MRRGWLFVVVAAFLQFANGQSAVEIGNPRWGLDLIVTSSPSQCGTFKVYYNITNVHDPTLHIDYPSDARIYLMTPDKDASTFLILEPPLGVGYLSWTCNLPAGSMFALSTQNIIGLSQVFTVGLGPSSCLNEGPVTTQVAYGSLIMPVYQTFTTASYDVVNGHDTPFHGDNFPAGSFPTITVDLGVRIAVAAHGPTSAVSTATTTSGQATSQGATAGKTSVSGSATSVTSPTGSLSTSGTASATSDAAGAAASGNSGAITSGGAGTVQAPGSTVTTTTTTTTMRTPVGAIVGGILGALLTGLLGGVAFMLWRRRQARRRREVSAHPIYVDDHPPDESVFPSTYASDTLLRASDKNRRFFADSTTRQSVLSAGTRGTMPWHRTAWFPARPSERPMSHSDTHSHFALTQGPEHPPPQYTPFSLKKELPVEKS